MADVPAWVLVLNTALAGGLGFGGAWVGTLTQRQTRREDAKRADAALMRDKAGEIFTEMRAIEGQAFVAVMDMVKLSAGLDEDQSVGSMPRLDTLYALVAVYYPSMLPILDAHAETDERHRKEAVATFLRGKDGVEPTLAYKLQINAGARTALLETLEAIRAQLVIEVQKFVPTPG
ncbi:hypothetical protein [Sphingomonas sp. S2-65]|uniref:hypothetical protein n=1 Tax=Sphingomonas sp. S2-65 TaxID=2903960 RepID=UPI001F1AB3F7|nr:hypothetical protein [Sphingomonas sp. S2-65]UYY59747.1 hypothetical protein LZ586_06595 [Sphingomonas sp. S2-65]